PLAPHRAYEHGYSFAHLQTFGYDQHFRLHGDSSDSSHGHTCMGTGPDSVPMGLFLQSRELLSKLGVSTSDINRTNFLIRTRVNHVVRTCFARKPGSGELRFAQHRKRGLLTWSLRFGSVKSRQK